MSRIQQTWNETCGRLGVKPRQFAALLAVLTVAVGALGMRAVSGSRRPAKAQSASTRSRPEATPAANEVRAVATRQVAAVSAEPTVEVSLEASCGRDPFKAWDAPVVAPVATAEAAGTGSGETETGTLPGLVLRAVVEGELAVLGDQTVRMGQRVAVGEEGHARVVAIGSRAVTVDFDGRRIEVPLGAMGEAARKPVTGGFR